MMACFLKRGAISMKGIILAGGSGTRLRPMTLAVNKHLLPVYDKPMVFYPLATLMQAGIRDILVITTPADKSIFENLLGDGSALGITLSYAVQQKPEGIAQALIIGKEFIGGEPCALILGDNIFLGDGVQMLLDQAARHKTGACVFAIPVADPQRFGVVAFDKQNKPTQLVEKPAKPISNWAVTGLYFYDGEAVSIAESIAPSARGELEITDLNNVYLERGALDVLRMDESCVWLDTGTPENLLQAGNYVHHTEVQKKIKLADLEGIAHEQGFITETMLKRAV